jgi:hypothetical protein
MPTTADDTPPITHRIHLFAGPIGVLDRFRMTVPVARLYRLTPSADIAVLPFDDAIQDALHVVNGTGDWLESSGHRLSTRDLAFAAEVSRIGPLAYLETDYSGRDGNQSAAFWIGGACTIGPLSLDTATALTRPAPFWPINAALRALGIKATTSEDEFTAFGLRGVVSNDAIHTNAIPARR